MADWKRGSLVRQNGHLGKKIKLGWPSVSGMEPNEFEAGAKAKQKIYIQYNISKIISDIFELTKSF